VHNQLERFVFAAGSPKLDFSPISGNFIACDSRECRYNPNSGTGLRV
jgi:hypothetical protein